MFSYRRFARGPWYPDMPPRLTALTDDEWIIALTDDRRSPFDHVRSFECATGFHTTCVGLCHCPHHTEPTITPYDAVSADAVNRLCQLHHLPTKTGCRILAHAQRAAESGEATNLHELRSVLEDVYNGSPIYYVFMRDVLSCLNYSKIPHGKERFT